jgi:hypothetical protein
MFRPTGQAVGKCRARPGARERRMTLSRGRGGQHFVAEASAFDISITGILMPYQSEHILERVATWATRTAPAGSRHRIGMASMPAKLNQRATPLIAPTL